MPRQLTAVRIACFALTLAACATQSRTHRADEGVEERHEAERLAMEIERAETALAAHLEAPRCEEACPLVDRICGLGVRICALSERHPTDDELERQCRSGTRSCDAAAARVTGAGCECGGDAPDAPE